MRDAMGKRILLAATALLALAARPAFGQQFNSDNYWTAPHGTQTTVATAGENYSLLLLVAALYPNWEVNLGATLYRADPQTNTPRYFSTTAYVKYMAYENEAKNGGWGIMAGTGVNPGHLEAGALTNDLKSYWATVPVTIPFLDGDVSWDLMPGISLNKEHGTVQDTTVGSAARATPTCRRSTRSACAGRARPWSPRSPTATPSATRAGAAGSSSAS